MIEMKLHNNHQTHSLPDDVWNEFPPLQVIHSFRLFRVQNNRQ